MGSFITRRNRRRRLAWGVCLLVGVLLSGVGRAEESPLIEQIDQMMIDIGAQLTNAKKILAMSSGVVEENPNGESGMGLTCCTNNLRTIAAKLRIIRASIQRMAVFYVEQENGQAIGILGDLEAHAFSVATGAAIFGSAPDEKSAAAALTGFVRPWNGFRNGVQSLRLCCPIPIPVDPEPPTSTVPDEGPSDKKSQKIESKGDPGDGDSPGA